jgi:hypothetical protein
VVTPAKTDHPSARISRAIQEIGRRTKERQTGRSKQLPRNMKTIAQALFFSDSAVPKKGIEAVNTNA